MSEDTEDRWHCPVTVRLMRTQTGMLRSSTSCHGRLEAVGVCEESLTRAGLAGLRRFVIPSGEAKDLGTLVNPSFT